MDVCRLPFFGVPLAWALHLRESFARRTSLFVWLRWSAAGLGTLLFGTGCPQLLANINSEGTDHLPRLSSDELTLRFTSSRAGDAGAAHLWTETRASINAEFA